MRNIIKQGTKMPHTHTSKSGRKLSVKRRSPAGKASSYYILDKDCRTIPYTGYGYNESRICISINAVPVPKQALFDFAEGQA